MSPAAMRCWDAELRSAVDTDWRDHAPALRTDPQALVQVMLTLPADLSPLPTGVTAIARSGRFATARVPRADLAVLAQAGIQVHLGEAIAPPRRTTPPRAPLALATAGPQASAPATRTLLAVIDDGCPFAHAALRRAGAPGTRVVSLWDQSQDVVAVHPPAPPGTVRPAHGVEWGRADLDALMALHTSAGHVDEAACYRAAGQDSLAHRWTHGAHVLGRLGADLAWHAGQHGGPAGAWPAQDAAAAADLAFVQLAREALLTVSPGAVAFHAFNAIHHLLGVARRLGHARLLIVLAYDSWLGPHDATSWFERAVDHLIGPTGVVNGVAVRLVLPAGNSGRQQAHQHFTPQDAASGPMHLFLAPDSELPTWVELWLPPAWVRQGFIAFKSPAGQSLRLPLGGSACWGPARQPVLAQYTDPPAPGALRQRILLRFAPTRARAGATAAPHGLWTIRLTGQPADAGEGLAYVGRAGQLMYQTVLARPSRLVVEPSKGRTLSGLAGGFHVLVAGPRYADVLAVKGPLAQRQGAARETIGPGDPVSYGGQPAARTRRRLVDAWVTTEEGLHLPGQLGMGTRSAVVWRMTGTSVAAPTVGRWQADVSPWPPFPGSLAGGPAMGWPWPFTTVAAAAP